MSCNLDLGPNATCLQISFAALLSYVISAQSTPIHIVLIKYGYDFFFCQSWSQIWYGTNNAKKTLLTQNFLVFVWNSWSLVEMHSNCHHNCPSIYLPIHTLKSWVDYAEKKILSSVKFFLECGIYPLDKTRLIYVEVSWITTCFWARIVCLCTPST